MNTVALFGAAGKVGTRIVDKLRDDPDLELLCVEAGEAGLAALCDQGLTPTGQQEAIDRADTIILAIPDTVIGRVGTEIVPQLHSGTMIMLLDPAAAHAGELPEREDVAYFIVHPCHPPFTSEDMTAEAREDYWGGTARQNIVCALMQGTEDDYAKGERLARKMFAPIINAHRITVEQMAILEPAMAETVILTCMSVIQESVEEAIRHGVPRQVAYDFALGHMRVNLGILFNYIDAEVSDGAKLTVQRAKEEIFQPDWKKVFEPQNVMEQVKAIVEGGQA
ncbi:MAG: phosphogluconate dehydrogenase C-terminal domain-containing protein [Chloroflexota bacterium]|nr:phosphogluconate dehydrogenase C-terminal domain-containing protein [Chloroflexota bacterium]